MSRLRASIIGVVFILLMFGLVMVYSSSAIYSAQLFGDSLFYFKKHFINLIIGFIASLFFMSIDCDILKKHAKHIILVTIGLLLCALIPGVGHSAGGASRWISFGFFNVQPSEIAKLSFLIYLAYFISKNESRMTNLLRGYLPVLIVCGTIMGLVLLEPDLGTAITIGFMMFLMLFIGGANLKHIASTIFLSVPFVYYLIFSVPYRRKRIMTFINPWLDEKGTGFQIVQSYIALGSGGLLGVGLGQSKQKLFFLPASHTDFILSIIGEELGFIGVMALLMLFFVLIWQGVRAAFKVNDVFKKMLIFGIVFMIAFEVIVNVGVSVGLFPTKGLPLPFLSYGGTSLIVHMIAIGILLNATRD